MYSQGPCLFFYEKYEKFQVFQREVTWASSRGQMTLLVLCPLRTVVRAVPGKLAKQCYAVKHFLSSWPLDHCIMDREYINFFISSNFEFVRSFVTIIFDSLKSDLSNLCKEKNVEISELRGNCNELKRSLKFSQHEICSLKTKCDIYVSKHT